MHQDLLVVTIKKNILDLIFNIGVSLFKMRCTRAKTQKLEKNDVIILSWNDEDRTQAQEKTD